ncbi:MAG: ABC transporter ATP-binding protein [Acidobacteriota bacterium]
MTRPDHDRPAIVADELSKLYRRTAAGHQLRTLKSALLERSLVKGLRPEDSIPALRDVSFAVRPGEAVGLIGSNGSGKSTLLKIAAGILQPTSGRLTVEGRVAALIELGAGFHPEISGRENIYINGAVLGLSRREIDERYESIVDFSGLADFIEEPVKFYSSGMYVRLGFAVAIHTDPDVLIVDEVLSVGDEAFAHKCLRKIEELLAAGKTLLLVSHSLGLIEDVCDRALWIEKGTLRLDGHPRRVADAYREAVAEAEADAHRQAASERDDEESAGDTAPDDDETDDGPVLRWGSGVVEIERLRLMVDDEETYHVRCGAAVRFEIDLMVHDAQDDFAFGLGLSTPRGVECWGINTTLAGLSPDRLDAGRTTLAVDCPNLRLAPGEYLADVAVHAVDGTPYDYRRQILSFTVTSDERGAGIYFPEHRWTFGDRISWCDPKPTASDD